MKRSETILFAGYDDMWLVCCEMARRMPPGVDGIAGVPVSGLASAGMLSCASGLPVYDIDHVPANCRKLLVLEDATEFMKFRGQYNGLTNGRAVVWSAVYAAGRAVAELDFLGVVAEKRRVFLWNLFKHPKGVTWMWDMDGVICENPTAQQVDYGPRYDAFIRDARPLRHMLFKKVGHIVTGRRERYRAATIDWLRRNGIGYQSLTMAPDEMAKTCAAHSAWKTEHYVKSNARLFVESHAAQAEYIAAQSGKPVVCTDNCTGYGTREPDPVQAGHTFKPVNKRVIYTISTGDYHRFSPMEFTPPAGWDYRVITDADCPSYFSAKQRAAWAKINGPRIMSQYEASLCIDDDMIVLQDPAPLFEGKGDWVALYNGNNSTWMRDLILVRDRRRAASSEQVDAEIKRYLAEGFTDSRNYMTGILYRRHTLEVIGLCDEWMQRYLVSETQRDQPSLAIAMQARKYEPETFSFAEADPYIRHDVGKANRDGVRLIVPANDAPTPEPVFMPLQKHRNKRKGSR